MGVGEGQHIGSVFDLCSVRYSSANNLQAVRPVGLTDLASERVEERRGKEMHEIMILHTHPSPNGCRISVVSLALVTGAD